MKETYLQTGFLEEFVEFIQQETNPFHPSRQLEFSPERSALLVLDMQRYFLAPESHAFIPSAEAILPNIQVLIASFRRRNLPVIFTQHANTSQDAGMMASWWRDLIKSESPFFAIDPSLNVHPGESIHKTQYDAFFATDLQDRLNQPGVTQLVICGVMTHLCVETTARSAFMRGFEVFLPVDSTATYNRRFHLASMLNLSHGFATLVVVQGLLQRLEAENAA